MDAITDPFIAFISNENNLVGLLALGLAAMIEYVLPPFPGDTITLFGAVLITAYQWSFWGVFGAVMAGSMVGSMMAFYIGGWWRKRRERRGYRHESVEHAVGRLVAKFKRHGAAYLVLNRFLPGIRSVFFVAAGMAEMRPLAVLGYSAVSAALWNLGLIAAGSALGANFDTLRAWVQRYTLATWIILGAVGLAWLAWTIIKRRLHRRRVARASSGARGGPSDA